MIDVLRETESFPDTYSDVPSDLTASALALDSALVWRRLESWISHRWQARSVVWIVSGAGVFEPRLRPATITAAERWNAIDEEWEAVTLRASPLGGRILDGGTYKITATVGDDSAAPAIVLEAYARLAEYFAEVGADTSLGLTAGTDGDYSFTRSAAHAARAMSYSGAADLLRGFR